MYSDQVVRNAFVIAQSQLLQLAKQLEFDADTSLWVDDAEETMREFWQQVTDNIDAYCERMRCVAAYQQRRRCAPDHRGRCQVAPQADASAASGGATAFVAYRAHIWYIRCCNSGTEH